MCYKARFSHLFRGIFSAKGYLPDPGKIQGHNQHASTQTKQELQSFLGAVNYMQTFVPHLSHHMEPLRVLLKKENTFAWDQNVNDSFQKIKGLLENTLLKLLKYYDKNKLVTLQCDTSLKGACIIQDSKPIAFTSKSLTDTETRYTNIERELLVIVFGCEKFHTYLYSRSFMVETDHKLLEMISLKNLISAPVHLQRMLLHLQQYNMVITYRPGEEMLLADALSCLPSWANNSEIKLDLWVDAISISAFSSSRLTETANETHKDPILSTVHWLTLNRWPRLWRHVPRIAYNYWDFRDELSIKGDLLMKGERIMIPTMCRDSILADLHKSHEGANQSLSLARTCVYWPGMGGGCSGLHQVVCNMYRQLKDASGNIASTWGPSQTIGENWYGFLPRWLREQIFNHCRLLQQIPIHLSCCNDTPQQDAEILERPVFNWRCMLAVVMTDNGPPFNGDEFKHFAWEFDFTHQTSSPHFHQSNGFIKAMVKKAKAAYKKTDGSPNAQAWELLQLWDTPLVSDLPSPAEILHGWPAQGAVMPHPHRLVNIQHIHQQLIEIQNTQKEHFDQAHRAKDDQVLKLREQAWFFPNKQYSMKLKWLTGTVRENLEWGCSYIIEGPNGKQYRRNWAHLKPICHDSSSFQDHSLAKKKNLSKSDNVDSFQDPRLKPKKKVMFEDSTTVIPLFEYNESADKTSESTSSTSHSSHQKQHFSPCSPSSSPPAQLSSREILVSPTAEDHTAQRHPASIQPQDIDTQLTTGLAALV